MDEYAIDLPEQLNAERVRRAVVESCGFKFLYGTERISEEGLERLYQLAEERQLREQLRAMQQGEPVNKVEGYPSENRPALHTALRDLFEDPPLAPEASALARVELEKLERFIEHHGERFTSIIQVGIGGSELGPKAAYLALEHLGNKKVFFVGNTDPDEMAMAIRAVNLSQTLVIVVSKSGTTLETATNEAFIRHTLKEAGLKAEAHCVSVTQPGTPMDDPHRYLETFHMWDWVGGRYSVSSMCGAVVLGMAVGMHAVWEFLKGAHAMDRAALERDGNLPLLGALLAYWNHSVLGHPTLALIPYSQALSRFPAHIQQLAMESNGKRVDRQGRTVEGQTGEIIWGEPGTNAQHSFFQLIHQGTQVVPVEFVGFKRSQCQVDYVFRQTSCQEKLLANLFAQAVALAKGQPSDNPNQVFPGNRPSHILLADQLTPWQLGALFSYFENKIVFEGFLWGINSFDQEGVQLGKKLANEFLEAMLQQKGLILGTPEPLTETYLELLDKV